MGGSCTIAVVLPTPSFNTMKHFLYAVSVVLLAGLMIWLGYLAGTKNGKSLGYGELMEAQHKVKTWRDSSYALHAKQQAAMVEVGALKHRNDSLLAVVRRDIGDKVDELENATSIATRVDGVARIPINIDMAELPGREDSMKPLASFDWTDSYLVLSGTIWADSLMIDYTYSDSLMVYHYREKQRFGRTGPLVVEVISRNPKTEDVVLKSLTVVEPKKRFIQTRGAAVLGGMVIGVSLSAATLILLK